MRKFALPLTLAAVVLVLDVATKAVVERSMELYSRIEKIGRAHV